MYVWNRENVEEFMVDWSNQFLFQALVPVISGLSRLWSTQTLQTVHGALLRPTKNYQAFLPAEMNDPGDLFYLAIHWGREDAIHYKCNALDQNTLYSMLRCMVSAASIADDRRLTKHSAHNFLVQKLSNPNIDLNHIKQGSGD